MVINFALEYKLIGRFIVNENASFTNRA